MSEEAEVPLTGGVVSGPVRVGETVRRPPGSAAVHKVLRHLAEAGFDGSPRLLGVDAKGRDIFSFIPGTVPIGQTLSGAAFERLAAIGVVDVMRAEAGDLVGRHDLRRALESAP